jgi:hypothetical protein
LSREIDVSAAEFSITRFSRRKLGLEKSRTYTRETAKIDLSLFKLSLTRSRASHEQVVTEIAEDGRAWMRACVGFLISTLAIILTPLIFAAV